MSRSTPASLRAIALAMVDDVEVALPLHQLALLDLTAVLDRTAILAAGTEGPSTFRMEPLSSMHQPSTPMPLLKGVLSMSKVGESKHFIMNQ
jgi:hypothetical protein